MYRVTFSRSLAEHINNKAGGKYKIQSVEIFPGRELAPGEKSATGVYALVARRKNKLLRCSLDYEIAQLLVADGSSRYLAEATIELL
jgi:hypothetical protein